MRSQRVRDAMISFRDMVASNGMLTRIDFNFNYLAEEHAELIAPAFDANKTLEQFELSIGIPSHLFQRMSRVAKGGGGGGKKGKKKKGKGKKKG